MNTQKIVVLGAGPTGLGACWRLTELGYSNWQLFEQQSSPGGLASSAVDEKGFTWDLGGHVIFSHYAYFDSLLDKLLGTDGWVDHIRESWVWMRERFIPYPLQNNIWRLPPEDLVPCIEGLLDMYKGNSSSPPKNFREWIVSNFGQGLANAFMVPYNKKVWAYDPQEMGTGWMGERVATVDVKRILQNLILQKDDIGWGPNAKFRFPLRGGTGSIWQALFNRLPKEKVHLNKQVTKIDPATKIIYFSDNSKESYDKIISTIPLDYLLQMVDDPKNNAKFIECSKNLKYSNTHIVGIGIEGKKPESLTTKCWMYYPEDNCPFYRATVFSNYSKYNVPNPGEQWSLMCEISESPSKPVNHKTIVEDTIQGCKNTKMLTDDAKVVSTWHTRLEHGYPTPFVGRDEILAQVQPILRGLGIWSRGRFGGWKYEVANQDHSLMQGVEAVDNILFGTEEITYDFPNVANAKKSHCRTEFAMKGLQTQN
jgi:protoporphyrinogen oxidase